MERKREKTETVGTGFGMVAAVAATGTDVVVIADDELGAELVVVREEELFSGVTGRDVAGEFCATGPEEPAFVSDC